MHNGRGLVVMPSNLLKKNKRTPFMFFDTIPLKHFDDSKLAAVYVAQAITKACHEAVNKHGIFHWVLAGGGTPELCYRLLRDEDLPWSSMHIWFGDERALPKDHPERNETMARHALLDYVPIPDKHIHSIDFSGGTEHAADLYSAKLSYIKRFDFVLLGMGEDGHTASLFPNNSALKSEMLATPVFNSPKPPSERVSMGLEALNRHQHCIILATGESKSEALKQIAAGADLPVSHIHDALWVVDQAAWPS